MEDGVGGVTQGLSNVTMHDMPMYDESEVDEPTTVSSINNMEDFLQKIRHDYFRISYSSKEELENIVHALWNTSISGPLHILSPDVVCNSIQYHIHRRRWKLEKMTNEEEFVIPEEYLTNQYLIFYLESVLYYYRVLCGGVHRVIVPLEDFIEKLIELTKENKFLLSVWKYSYYVINTQTGDITREIHRYDIGNVLEQVQYVIRSGEVEYEDYSNFLSIPEMTPRKLFDLWRTDPASLETYESYAKLPNLMPVERLILDNLPYLQGDREHVSDEEFNFLLTEIRKKYSDKYLLMKTNRMDIEIIVHVHAAQSFLYDFHGAGYLASGDLSWYKRRLGGSDEEKVTFVPSLERYYHEGCNLEEEKFQPTPKLEERIQQSFQRREGSSSLPEENRYYVRGDWTDLVHYNIARVTTNHPHRTITVRAIQDKAWFTSSLLYMNDVNFNYYLHSSEATITPACVTDVSSSYESSHNCRFEDRDVFSIDRDGFEGVRRLKFMKSEKDVFEALGLLYIPPTIRREWNLRWIDYDGVWFTKIAPPDNVILRLREKDPIKYEFLTTRQERKEREEREREQPEKRESEREEREQPKRRESERQGPVGWEPPKRASNSNSSSSNKEKKRNTKRREERSKKN